MEQRGVQAWDEGRGPEQPQSPKGWKQLVWCSVAGHQTNATLGAARKISLRGKKRTKNHYQHT